MLKIPDGFKSWVNFYDYLAQEKPELLQARTIIFYTPIPGKEFKSKKVRMRVDTIERNCWREIADDRLTMQEWHELHDECNIGIRYKFWRFVTAIAKLPRL